MDYEDDSPYIRRNNELEEQMRKNRLKTLEDHLKDKLDKQKKEEKEETEKNKEKKEDKKESKTTGCCPGCFIVEYIYFGTMLMIIAFVTYTVYKYYT